MSINLTPFKNLIRERTGLSLSSEPSRIGEEIRRRMALRNIKSPEDYFDLLLRDGNEFLVILNFLTVNETYFFREPVHLDLLTRKIIPQMLERDRHGRPIHILSAGCSTGEEPYSIAIALTEKYGAKASRELFSIIGIDIDTNTIRRAKEGIYRGQSFRSLDRQIMDNYFEPLEGKTYRIKEPLKGMVHFRCSNLLEISHMGIVMEPDVIFYRNVSIYFEEEVRKSVFIGLSRLLNDGGYLIVSATETLSHHFDVLPLIEMDGAFLFHKPTGPVQVKQGYVPPYEHEHGHEQGDKYEHEHEHEHEHECGHGEERLEPSSVPEEQYKREDGEDHYKRALDLAEKKKYSEALKILDGLLKEGPLLTKVCILKAGILINLREMEEAKGLCLKAVEADVFCMDGYFLLGIIARHEDNPEEAVKRLKEALYIRTSSWLVHYYLAETYRNTGKAELARREYGIVIRLLEKGAFSDHGVSFFPLSFSEEQVIHLCRQNMLMV